MNSINGEVFVKSLTLVVAVSREITCRKYEGVV